VAGLDRNQWPECVGICKRQPKVYYPKDTGGFLNYNLTYFAGDSFTYNSTILTNQLGFRVGDFLFLSDSSYTHGRVEGGEFVRLMSNITYDRREDLKRLIIGDFFASSGEFGSTLNMGGLSFSKNYGINPYFIKYPEMSFSGLASLPSELEIYSDGVLIRKERISPGGFELRDIPTYGGSGLNEIVLKDTFGREQRITLPYYFSETLLKKGFHEYSYNVGFLREGFGTVSNRYKDFAFLGYHRYGMSDYLTGGIRGEASEKVLNLGLSSTILIPKRLGIVSISLAWSDSKGRNDGLAGAINYLYQRGNLSFNFLLRGFTQDYSNILLVTTTERTKYEVSVGAGYTSAVLGSISLGFANSKKYIGTDTENILASYSRNIIGPFNVFATFNRDMKEKTIEVMVSLNYYFKHGITGSATYRRKDGISNEGVQIAKNLSLGEGFGGRAFFERNQRESETYNNYNLQLQYNTRHNQFSGEFMSMNRVEAYSLSAAGGITFIKDSLNFTRPVSDSFALVKVGDLKGVRAYFNNQEMGRTGASGKLLIPNVGSYYENQISIDSKDIPVEYTVSEVKKYVSPPLRSGSYLDFGAMKIQGVTGMLKVKAEGEIKPVEYIEFKLMVDGKELLLPTGKGGEFYIENIKPDKYRGDFEYLDKIYFFDMVIPKSDEVIIDLGEIICE